MALKDPVFIKHPNGEGIGGPIERVSFAFWETKGWAIVPDPNAVDTESAPADAAPAGPPPGSLGGSPPPPGALGGSPSSPADPPPEGNKTA